MLQRGRALSSAERNRNLPVNDASRRFNGAALFRARRGTHHRGRQARHRASTGPRSFERGEAPSRASGHPLETASTGPRSFERGEAAVVGVARHADSASTGPRSFERGEVRYLDAPPLLPVASTGPRSFERGEARDRCSADKGRPCFNGAALFRARRGLGGSRRCPRPAGFNGAALFRARRGGRSGLLDGRWLASTGPRSFERGEAGGEQGRVADQVASTGPRSFERGEDATAGDVVRIPIGFNGAALFRARRAASRAPSLHTRPRASTGPRSFERGEATGLRPRGQR